MLEIVQAWADVLAGRELIDWGGVALHVRKVVPVDPPEFAAGQARLRTLTPVVMKGSGRDGDGVRRTRQAWVLPSEPVPGVLIGNLRRKAHTLGLDPDVELDAITWVGPKRCSPCPVVSSRERRSRRNCGAPETLRAIWSWGLGQANSAGFGWVAA